VRQDEFEHMLTRLIGLAGKIKSGEIEINRLEQRDCELVNRLNKSQEEINGLRDKLMVTDHYSAKIKESLDGLYVALCDVVENVESDAPEMWQRCEDALAKAKVFRDAP